LACATLKAGLAPEYMAVDLRAALRAVGEITGAENVDEILDSLFAQFCIGK
jgi:tRNA modification GTPase